MEDLVVKLLYNVIYLLAAVAAAFVIGYLKQKLGVEKLRKFETQLLSKERLAELAVMFAQQAYKDLGGAQKYNEAAAWFEDQCLQHGFEISDEEIKGLIEAALKSLKREFGEQWEEVVKDE